MHYPTLSASRATQSLPYSTPPPESTARQRQAVVSRRGSSHERPETRQNSEMADSIELGVDTFGDVTVGADGTLLTQAQTLRNVIEQGALADQVGLDFFGVGEHHRADFAIAA